MTKLVSLVFAAIALASAATGCSAADPVTNHFTCDDVCQTYADCFNDKYDVDECRLKDPLKDRVKSEA
ncbi:MAG: hypothetical protein ABJB12_14500 [Pseudomonadota bacterium]